MINIDDVIGWMITRIVEEDRKNTTGYKPPYEIDRLFIEYKKANKLDIEDHIKKYVIDKITKYDIFDFDNTISKSRISIYANATTNYIYDTKGYASWIKEKEEHEKLKKDAEKASLKKVIKEEKMQWLVIGTFTIALATLAILIYDTFFKR